MLHFPFLLWHSAREGSRHRSREFVALGMYTMMLFFWHRVSQTRKRRRKKKGPNQRYEKNNSCPPPSPAQCPLGLRPQYTRCSVVVEGGPPLGKCASKRSLLLSRPGVRFFHRCTAVPLRARERKETYSASLASFPHLQCAVLYGHSCPFQAFAFIPSLAWPKMNKCFFLSSFPQASALCCALATATTRTAHAGASPGGRAPSAS